MSLHSWSRIENFYNGRRKTRTGSRMTWRKSWNRTLTLICFSCTYHVTLYTVHVSSNLIITADSETKTLSCANFEKKIWGGRTAAAVVYRHCTDSSACSVSSYPGPRHLRLGHWEVTYSNHNLRHHLHRNKSTASSTSRTAPCQHWYVHYCLSGSCIPNVTMLRRLLT